MKRCVTKFNKILIVTFALFLTLGTIGLSGHVSAQANNETTEEETDDPLTEQTVEYPVQTSEDDSTITIDELETVTSETNTVEEQSQIVDYYSEQVDDQLESPNEEVFSIDGNEEEETKQINQEENNEGIDKIEQAVEGDDVEEELQDTSVEEETSVENSFENLTVDKLKDYCKENDSKLVAVIDTGVSKEYSKFQVNFTDEEDDDLSGHGTLIAKRILENANGKAVILSLKAFTSEGKGTIANVMKALQYAKDMNVDIINMSFSSTKDEANLDKIAFENYCVDLVNNGIAIVAAAGNQNKDASNYIPVSDPGVISVGAIRIEAATKYKQSFSNFGAFISYWEEASSTSEACAILTGKIASGSDLSSETTYHEYDKIVILNDPSVDEDMNDDDFYSQVSYSQATLIPCPTTYYVQSQLNTNRYLHVENASSANGAGVVTWTGYGNKNTQWTFNRVGLSKYYYISCMNNCLELPGDPPDNLSNRNAEMWSWSSSKDDYFWYLIDRGNGRYSFINKYTNQMLHIQGYSDGDGVAIDTYSCSDNDLSAMFKLNEVNNEIRMNFYYYLDGTQLSSSAVKHCTTTAYINGSQVSTSGSFNEFSGKLNDTYRVVITPDAGYKAEQTVFTGLVGNASVWSTGAVYTTVNVKLHTLYYLNVNLLDPGGVERTDGSIGTFSYTYSSFGSSGATNVGDCCTNTDNVNGRAYRVGQLKLKNGYVYTGTKVTDSSGTTTNVSPWNDGFVRQINGNTTVDIYTRWAKVTVNPNGGSWNGTTSSTTKTCSSANGTLSVANPVRTGYTFTGWTLSGGGSRSGTTYSYGTSDGTLTANWTANTYTNTLTYNANGGSGAPSAQTATVTYPSTQSTFTLSTTKPTRTGYTFKGWFTAATGGTQITATTYTVGKASNAGNQSATLYAQWTANQYSLILNPNGGAFSDSSTSAKTLSPNLIYDSANWNNISANTPTKTGYILDGWYDAATGGTKVYNASGTCISGTKYWTGTAYKNAASLTVYAHWTAKTITVNFYRNTSTSDTTLTTQKFTYGTSGQKFNANTWTKTGYTFKGWSTSQSATTSTYSNQCGVVDSWINSNYPSINLYAVWTANTYTNTLKYDANGGSGAPSNQTATVTYPSTQSTFTLSTTKPTKTGYTFAGWYTAASGGTQVSGTYTLGNANNAGAQSATLYAHWTANTYTNTLTYNANNGTGAPSAQTATVTYPNTQSTFTLSTTKPTRTGYTFKGWFTAATGGTQVTTTTYAVGSASKASNQSATLYAQWTANTYTVTYNSNKGSGTMTADTATYDSNFTPKANTFTYTNYHFKGWNTSADGKGTSYTAGTAFKWTLTSNITLYAQWTANAYLDLNGLLDGTLSGGISGYGTADVYINGTQVSNDVTDYCRPIAPGAKYEIKDIKATTGHTYQGVSSGSLTGTMGESRVNVVLKFATNTWTVKYDANGGKGDTMPNTTHKWGGGVVLSTNTYKKGGFKFTGWTASRTYNSKEQWLYWDGKTFTNGGAWYEKDAQPSGYVLYTYTDGATAQWTTSVNSDTLTFHAQWERIPYSISYNLNSGTLANAPTSYTQSSANTTIGSPTKAGYRFLNWTESLSTLDWTDGFINMSTGAYEKNSSYPNSVYSEKFFLKKGVKYTITGTNLGGIRWRAFSANGAYLGSKSSEATYTPDQDMYVSILLYGGCTETNRNAMKITSTQSSPVTIATGSTGNRSYTANYVQVYNLTIKHLVSGNGGSRVKSFKYKIAFPYTNSVTYTIKYADGTTGTFNGNGYLPEFSLTHDESVVIQGVTADEINSIKSAVNNINFSSDGYVTTNSYDALTNTITFSNANNIAVPTGNHNGDAFVWIFGVSFLGIVLMLVTKKLKKKA